MSERDRLAAELALRTGDNALVLGQRLCAWIGSSHEIEEDLAQANIALDLVGQARAWLSLAGELDGSSRTEDDLAYLRDESEFRNVSLVEQPNGDFGATVCRQLLFDAWHVARLRAMRESSHERVADIAATACREATYHLRHSGSWFVRLADGTDESRERVLGPLAELWPLCGEMVGHDETDDRIAGEGIGPAHGPVLDEWRATVSRVFAEARVEVPPEDLFASGLRGKAGCHTEHLGPVLEVLQGTARRHPGARW